MSTCTVFEEEETMLQSMGTLMGVAIDRSPKCQCEIAGEGIEYTWACAKNHYQGILLDKKKVRRISHKVLENAFQKMC
jgi:hypothetical protein